MKYVTVLVLGILAGLAFSRIPHYLDYYAYHSLPEDWKGPKMRMWKNGVEVHE